MQDNTYDQLKASVNGTAADLEALVAIAQGEDADNASDLFKDHGYELDENDATEQASEILNEMPLEAYAVGRKDPGGSWEMTHVVVVFGTGGPHIELDTSERAVLGYWSGDTVRHGVSQDVCDYFEQWFE